jgi:hypothetical protein
MDSSSLAFHCIASSSSDNESSWREVSPFMVFSWSVSEWVI